MSAFEEWGEVNLPIVRNQVEALGTDVDEIVVNLNSVGGDVTEGFAIHDYLTQLPQNIIVNITGLCASIATVIAQAGNEIWITENSQFMIHNPYMWAEGDADSLEKQAEFLRNTEERIVNFYADKTGLAIDVLNELMSAETWLTAQEALDVGFVTKVTTATEAASNALRVAKNKNKSQPYKAVALLKFSQPKRQIKMSVVESLINKAKNIFTPKAMAYTLEGGEVINTDSEDAIAVGQTATDSEGVALGAGDYTLEDGTVITVGEAGEITAVTEAEPAATEDVEANAEGVEVALQAIVAIDERVETLTESINKLVEAQAADHAALAAITSAGAPAAKAVTTRPVPKATPKPTGVNIKDSIADFKASHSKRVTK